jgi:predicted TIM-barrel fold metal-dependent hydrolase
MKKSILFFSAAVVLVISGFIAGVNADDTDTSPFSPSELKSFTAIEPVDTHAHAFKNDPAFFDMMNRLHLHILDICVAKRNDADFPDLASKINAGKSFVKASGGRAAFCTTFDPFKFSEAAFSREAIAQLDRDFADGAVAVKIWKNIGMELKDSKGNFVMPDNSRFEPIYQDIAAHGKTMVAHLAEPDSCWLPPDKNSPDSRYYQEHPEWYMYTKPDHPSKRAILQARDHLVEGNPKLRVIGAHLGSMERDLDEIGRDLDRYPNFAIDTAARVIYLALQPRDKARQFLIKYQDRILYATDLEFYPREEAQNALRAWQKRYATDWRFFSTSDVVDYRGHKVHGLALPQPVLRKLYHDNAVRWIPGMIRAN